VNFNQLPVNRPNYYYNPSRRDGANNVMNYGSIPNYIPSSFAPKIVPAPQYLQLASHEEWAGTVTEFQSAVTDDDFVQPRAAWEALGLQQGQQENFVSNVAGSLSGATSQVRQQTYCKFVFLCVELWQRLTMTIAIFGQINGDLGSLIKNATETLASTM
jgi:catalase